MLWGVSVSWLLQMAKLLSREEGVPFLLSFQVPQICIESYYVILFYSSFLKKDENNESQKGQSQSPAEGIATEPQVKSGQVK